MAECIRWLTVSFLYWLIAVLYQKVMRGLICWLNSCGMGSDTVIMLGVDVVVCWDFRGLFWLHLLCILWELCCCGCVVLVCMALLDWLMLFAWCISVCLYCQCTLVDLRTKMDVLMCVVAVWVLWAGWNCIWYCRWVVVWVVGGVDLHLDER